MTDASAGAGSQTGDDLPQVPGWQETPVVGASGAAGASGTHDAAVRDAPTPLVPQAHVDAVLARAGQIVPPLAKAVTWLRWPSLLLLVVGAAGPLLLGSLALSWQGWPRIAGLVVAVLAVVPVVLFGRARAGTLAAARNPVALTSELADFAAHLNGGLAVLDKLAAVAEGGGLRILWRLRALWAVVQLPADALDHLGKLPTLRWFLPPQVPETWVRLVTMLWSSVGCYALTSVLGALSLTPVL